MDLWARTGLIDVQSYKSVSAVVHLAVLATVLSQHEPHVGVQGGQSTHFSGRMVRPRHHDVDVGKADEAVKVRDG